jgi:hypothetical protein
MFAITSHKGFQITFENGCTISVQFGPGNYCQNRSADFNAPMEKSRWKSVDAEVAILLPNGDFYQIAETVCDKVQGWQTVEDVCRWIEVARSIKTNVNV